MVIKSQIERTIGEQVSNGLITDDIGRIHQIPFVVLEEVTYEDYLADRKLTGGPIGYIYKNDHFYRISID